MYIGDGKVIHAPRPGRTVTVATMDAAYRSHVNAIRRVPGSTLDGITSAGFPSPGDILDWEKGFADSLLGAGKSVVGGAVTGTLLGPLKIVGGALGNIAGGMLSIGKFAELLLRLALPSTWVRIVCGLLGSVLLLLGTGFLVREARGAA
jgi:hypothetical protein